MERALDSDEQRLRRVNLNLLPVLREILRHQNLTRAATELNLTQSAVSNSLRRLRDHFQDELLVKDGRGLRLTRKARELIAPLDAVLDAAASLLVDAPFDAAHTHCKFRIASVDYVATVLAPALARILGEDAPGISVQMVTARRNSVEDLRHENIDLLIAPREFVANWAFVANAQDAQFKFEELARDTFVCLCRKDDASIGASITQEDYLARPHASFCLDIDLHASLEQSFLASHGLDQFDRVSVSEFGTLAHIVDQTDCIALLPASLARMVVPSLPLRTVPAPLPVPDLELVMVWLGQRDRSREIEWLRAALHRCVAAVGLASV